MKIVFKVILQCTTTKKSNITNLKLAKIRFVIELNRILINKTKKGELDFQIFWKMFEKRTCTLFLQVLTVDG